MNLRDVIPFLAPKSATVKIVEPSTPFVDVPNHDQWVAERNAQPVFAAESDTVAAEIHILQATPQIDFGFWHPDVVVAQGAREDLSKISVAYVISEGLLEFAVSYCSPKDQFSRRLGRVQAQSRFLAGDIAAVPTVGTLSGVQARAVMESLIDIGHLIDLPHFPSNQAITVIC